MSKVGFDVDDMPEITDFSKGRKNPLLAQKLKKEGYTIRIHYSPEDIVNMSGAELCALDADEKAALAKYHAVNDNG